MKLVIIIFLTFTFNYSFCQNKSRNIDSLEWEKENLNWEKELFTDMELVNKLEVSNSDNSMTLQMSMRQECRIFGYKYPDKNSKKMVLISNWTFDVKDNPCRCQFGSHYETRDDSEMEYKYLRNMNSFVEAAVFKQNKQIGIVYFEKKWIKFID